MPRGAVTAASARGLEAAARAKQAVRERVRALLERERFGGWIAGLGTAGVHRLVVGHWPRSPFGPVTDVMVEDPAGRRTLYAPTPQLAAFLGAAYRFDDVQVAACGARRSGPGWTVQAGPLRLSFTGGTPPTTCTPSSPPRPPWPAATWARSARSSRRSASASARCRPDPSQEETT